MLHRRGLEWSDLNAVFSGMEIMVSSMHNLVHTLSIALLSLKILWSLLVGPCVKEANASALHLKPSWVELDHSCLSIPREFSTIAGRDGPCFKDPLPCDCPLPLISVVEDCLWIASFAHPKRTMLAVASIEGI